MEYPRKENSGQKDEQLQRPYEPLFGLKERVRKPRKLSSTTHWLGREMQQKMKSKRQ